MPAFRRPPAALLLLATVTPSLLAPSLAKAAQAANKPATASPPAPAQPSQGWYFEGKGGPSLTTLSGMEAVTGKSVTETDATNAVGAFGMGAGYEWAHRYHIPLRTELEFMNRTDMTYNASPAIASQAGALASSVQNVTIMAKGYWYFPVGSTQWWPFVSGGLGWSHNTVKSGFTSPDGRMTKNTHATDSLAWSAGVGATFKLGPQVMNDIELRYVDLGTVDWGMPESRDLRADSPGGFSATELVFSLRYMF